MSLYKYPLGRAKIAILKKSPDKWQVALNSLLRQRLSWPSSVPRSSRGAAWPWSTCEDPSWSERRCPQPALGHASQHQLISGSVRWTKTIHVIVAFDHHCADNTNMKTMNRSLARLSQLPHEQFDFLFNIFLKCDFKIWVILLLTSMDRFYLIYINVYLIFIMILITLWNCHWFELQTQPILGPNIYLEQIPTMYVFPMSMSSNRSHTCTDFWHKIIGFSNPVAWYNVCLAIILSVWNIVFTDQIDI